MNWAHSDSTIQTKVQYQIHFESFRYRKASSHHKKEEQETWSFDHLCIEEGARSLEDVAVEGLEREHLAGGDDAVDLLVVDDEKEEDGQVLGGSQRQRRGGQERRRRPVPCPRWPPVLAAQIST